MTSTPGNLDALFSSLVAALDDKRKSLAELEQKMAEAQSQVEAQVAAGGHEPAPLYHTILIDEPVSTANLP